MLLLCMEFQGRYEIRTLSGTFLPNKYHGRRGGSSVMSISLVDLDGHVVAGRVAGALVAASPVTVSTLEGNIRSIKSKQMFKGLICF